jgi:molybdopterin converting factor small subunit
MPRKSSKESGKISIKVKGPISLAIGEELTIEINEKKTIREIWEYLKEKYKDKAIEHGIYPALEDLPSQNLILVNDIEISALNELETHVKPGDKITIINYTHGG